MGHLKLYLALRRRREPQAASGRQRRRRRQPGRWQRRRRQRRRRRRQRRRRRRRRRWQRARPRRRRRRAAAEEEEARQAPVRGRAAAQGARGSAAREGLDSALGVVRQPSAAQARTRTRTSHSKALSVLEWPLARMPPGPLAPPRQLDPRPLMRPLTRPAPLPVGHGITSKIYTGQISSVRRSYWLFQAAVNKHPPSHTTSPSHRPTLACQYDHVAGPPRHQAAFRRVHALFVPPTSAAAGHRVLDLSLAPEDDLAV